MEKVLLSDGTIDEYKFTEEDKEALLYELGERQHYPPEIIRMFINHMERFCSATMEALDKPARTEDRNIKRRMVGRFERAIEDLELLADYKIQLEYPFVLYMEPELVEDPIHGLISIGPPDGLYVPDECSTYPTTAYETKKALQELVRLLKENLEATRRPRGRRAGADPTGLILALAHIFSAYFGKPTAYDDGPFAEVVRIAHRTVGLPHQDLSRGIKKAVSQWKERTSRQR